MTSLEDGTLANNLSGELVPVEGIDWLTNALTDAPSSGGVDDEEEDEYLNRLSNNFALMAPRPILAPDFALIARNVAGIQRAIAIDNYIVGTNQVDKIDFTGTVTGGTYTITLDTQVTAAIAYNATAAQVKAAIELLANTEPGDVDVTLGPGPTDMNVTHQGRYAYTARTMSITSSVTGGGTLVKTIVTAAVAANAVAENALVVAAIDSSGNAIAPATKTALDVYLQAMRQQNFNINILDPVYTTVTINYTAVKTTNSSAADVKLRADAAITQYLSPSFWGVPVWPPDARGWERKTVLRAQELYTILNNVDGLDFVSALTFNGGATGVVDATDKTLIGTFPLPRVGVITSTVT
jgi:hypothetical protein